MSARVHRMPAAADLLVDARRLYALVRASEASMSLVLAGLPANTPWDTHLELRGMRDALRSVLAHYAHLRPGPEAGAE
jgi:hypothetical protein